MGCFHGPGLGKSPLGYLKATRCSLDWTIAEDDSLLLTFFEGRVPTKQHANESQ